MTTSVPDFHLTQNDQMVLVQALDLLAEDNIEGADASAMAAMRERAKALITRINHAEDDFTAEDMRVMYISLLNLRIAVNEFDGSEQSDDRIAADLISKIDLLTTRFAKVFKSIGIRIDHF